MSRKSKGRTERRHTAHSIGKKGDLTRKSTHKMRSRMGTKQYNELLARGAANLDWLLGRIGIKKDNI